jgi:hypothetical protein
MFKLLEAYSVPAVKSYIRKESHKKIIVTLLLPCKPKS